MSELDDLRTQNQELKRLLRNALELLEKTKEALTKKQQTLTGDRKSPARRSASKTGAAKVAATFKAGAKKLPRTQKRSVS